jgi:SAM-dependent methyltransferase
MATMPAMPDHGQLPTVQPQASASAWFATPAGVAILDSEADLILQALAERPAQPWLWLAPVRSGSGQAGRPEHRQPEGRGLHLAPDQQGWAGAVRCGLPWPIASESFGSVVLQHVVPAGAASRPLLEECARILSPGGALWLLGLNPLAPYRWHWRASGLGASEPLTWRRRLRAAGLTPTPVSRGVGPRWRPAADANTQDGPGLRAAYALRADKRTIPLTPVRGRALRLENVSPA